MFLDLKIFTTDCLIDYGLLYYGLDNVYRERIEESGHVHSFIYRDSELEWNSNSDEGSITDIYSSVQNALEMHVQM